MSAPTFEIRCKSCRRLLGVATGNLSGTYCDEACKAFPPARDQENRNLLVLYMRAYEGASFRVLSATMGITVSTVGLILNQYDPKTN